MSADDIRGVVVDGYTVRRRIGEGGFAAVFEATQDDIGAPVALKILTTGIGQAQSQRRLEREYRSMGRLRDLRGIVPVYGTAETAEGLPVIVMAYMAGGSLHDRLRASGPMPVDEVLHVVDVLCDALQAAHDVGIHHRDIKPENVLLDRYGEPALSDFGLATIEGMRDASQTAASLSPPHAPPEKFLGDGVVDPVAADIYSLASTIHQLLTGRPPFGTSSEGGIAALILRITGEDTPTIDRADVPAGLAEAIRAGLSKAPADRPKGPREFAELVRSTPGVTPSEPPLQTEVPTRDVAPAAVKDTTSQTESTRAIETGAVTLHAEGTRVVAPAAPDPRRRKWVKPVVIGAGATMLIALVAISVDQPPRGRGLAGPLRAIGSNRIAYQTGTAYQVAETSWLLRCGQHQDDCGRNNGEYRDKVNNIVRADGPWDFRGLASGCYAVYDVGRDSTDGRRISNVVCL